MKTALYSYGFAIDTLSFSFPTTPTSGGDYLWIAGTHFTIGDRHLLGVDRPADLQKAALNVNKLLCIAGWHGLLANRVRSTRCIDVSCWR